MANTVWSTSDKSAGITLSGGNLIATNNNNALAGVRAADKQISGKLYWECLCNTIGNSLNSIGIATADAALVSNISSIAANTYGTAGVIKSGQIYISGVNQATGIGALTTGSLVCVAVDFNARLIWFRLGAGGNWNGLASANPATGVGGFSIYSFGYALPAYPFVQVNNTNDQVTANFGDSAFTGAVPSGYTAGFPAGATSSTNALATQAAAEQWITTNPPAQITQVALEEWTSVQNTPPNVYTGVLSGSRTGIGSAVVSSTPALITPNLVGIGVVGLPLAILPSARVTQVALEEWAAVAPAVPVEAWVTQVSLEEWASVGPTFEYAKVGGLVREGILTADGRVFVYSLARETLTHNVTIVKVNGMVRETLVSGTIIPRQYAVPVS